MPHHSKTNALHEAVAKTKSKKSSKCCTPSPCETDCCVPETSLDCCSIAYQRLDKLRNAWSLIATSGGTTSSLFPSSAGSEIILNVFQRNGTPVKIPNETIYPDDVNTPYYANSSSGELSVTEGYDNTFYGYLFVNTHRYVTFEVCGKQDQVVGWYVNTSNGQLQLFQNLPELNLSTFNTRLSLDTLPTANLSSIQKSQLYALNVLYKASVKAITLVGGNPKEEGNIVELTDKCGQKWLLTINSANSPTNVNSSCNPSNEYVIVGVPL